MTWPWIDSHIQWIRDHFLELLISHSAVGLLVLVFAKFNVWVADFFSRIRRRPQVKAFEKRLELTAYNKRPKERPHCFMREGYTPRAKESPTYHFFIDPDLRLQRFMAFLIPSIASGYGRRQHSRHEIGRAFTKEHLQFDPNWAIYLKGIGVKIQGAAEHETGHLEKEALREHHQLPIEAARIIFFDKDVLRLFLFGHDWIFERAKTISDHPLTLFAEDIIHYAYDIVTIHDRTKSYDKIKCRYVSESTVASSECYDFGLYTIDGVDIVYTPIHLKDGDKTITQEKVYIGSHSRHRRRIQEFVEDFDKTWKAAEAQCEEQHGKEDEVDATHLNDPNYEVFGADYLTSEFFETVYCKRIKELLKDHLQAVFPIIEPPVKRSRAAQT